MSDPVTTRIPAGSQQPAGCPFSVGSKAVPGVQYRRSLLRPRDPAVRREIDSLDAQRDCERIVFLLTAYEFPFDMLRSTELALFHTYGSESVSRLLDRTNEFARGGQKRYDDTRLLIAQFMESGWSGEAGRRSIEQMNHIHSFFRIPNEDFLFVLWTFIHFPVRWMDDYGWRAFTEHERTAWFTYWCEIGRRMGMKNIPVDHAAYARFVADYEARTFVRSEASYRVAEATMDVLASWLPRPLRPLVRPVALSLSDPKLVAALGYPAPPAWLGRLARGVLKLRAWGKRWVSFEGYPVLVVDTVNRTYPGHRYRIEALGPDYAHRDQQGSPTQEQRDVRSGT